MKKTLFLLSAFAFSLSASATAYVVTGNSYVVPQKGPIPPCTYSVTPAPASFKATFTGLPVCSIVGVTSNSSIGTYAGSVALSAGAMEVKSSNDSVEFQPGSLEVIAASGNYARINNTVTYPTKNEFYSGPSGGGTGLGMAEINSVLNVVTQSMIPCVVSGCPSSGFAQLIGDGKTDNSVALQQLLAARLNVTEFIASTSASSNTIHISNGSFTGFSDGAQVLVGGTGSIYTIAPGGTAPNQLTLCTAGASGCPASVPPLPTLSSAYIINAAALVGNYSRHSQFLYFPSAPACYAVSTPVKVFGNYWTWFGNGPSVSCLSLLPNSPLFNAPPSAQNTNGVAWIDVSSVMLNENFDTFINGMGFRIGAGNPLANGIKWVNNNVGEINDVVVWNDDSAANSCIDLAYPYPGPTMLKNVATYGCQYGQTLGQVQYSITEEGITNEGASVAAISNVNNHLSLRHWLCAGTTPCYVSLGHATNLAFRDSQLYFTGTGSTTVTAMTIGKNGGQIVGQYVECSGYSTCLSDSGTGTEVNYYNTLPSLFYTGEAQTLFNAALPPATPGIAVQETPRAPMPGATSGKALGTDPTTWCATIAAASGIVFLPPGMYNNPTAASINCKVPDSVTLIEGYNSEYRTSVKIAGGVVVGGAITFTVASNAHTPLTIDGMYGNNMYLVHTGSRPVSVTNSNVAYQTNATAPTIFFEDDQFFSTAGVYLGAGPVFFPGQKVFARQFDDEIGYQPGGVFSTTDVTTNPKLTCNGCSMWLLGLKTEHNSPFLFTNAKVEIWGYFLYYLHVSPMPAGSSQMQLTDTSSFLTGFSFVNGCNYGPSSTVVETRETANFDLPYPNQCASELLNFYY